MRKMMIPAIFVMAGFAVSAIVFSNDQQSSAKDIRKAYSDMCKLLSSEAFLKEPNRASRRQSVKGVMADYDSEPRLSDDPVGIASANSETRVDVAQLVKHCEELGVNCYHFLIWHQPTDWEDFKLFVAAVEKSKILTERKFTIWIYLVPPSESQGMKSEPFGMDYVVWMENIARLSREHPIVSAVCIDDFYGTKENRDLYTRDYLRRMREAADKYDPSLALVTVLYWDDIDPVKELEVMEEASVIGDSIDGILYPYMAQSLKKGLSHKDTYALASEIKRVREVYPGIPVILDIYVTKHSGSPDLPGPKWVEGLLDIAKENADGVALYCMPKKNKNGSFADFWGKSMDNTPQIFETVKAKYNGWLRSGWKRTNFCL